MVSFFIIVVHFRKFKPFLCSTVAEKQVEQELVKLNAIDNVEKNLNFTQK